MKTIIKIPLYVEVSHREGMDRKVLSDAVRGILHNEIIESLRDGNTSRYFSDRKMKLFHQQIGSDSTYRFVTEFEIFHKPNQILGVQKLSDPFKDLLK